MNKRLCRSNRNRILFGICGGIGEYLNIDPTIIRVIWLFCTIFMGLNIFFYFLLLLIIPNSDY